MKRMTKLAAQGDLLLRRIEEIPDQATEAVDREGGRLVVAHSETGHHHAIGATSAELWREPGNPMIAYLRVAGQEDALLEHHRPWDTHETIAIPPGTYELRRQREYTPAGWRRVED